MEFVAIMPFLIPIVAILAGSYVKVTKMKAEATAEIGRATADLERALDDAEAERDRLRTRIEALEAIVTDEGYDLERDARRALSGQPLAARTPLLDDPLDGFAPEADRPRTRRRDRA